MAETPLKYIEIIRYSQKKTNEITFNTKQNYLIKSNKNLNDVKRQSKIRYQGRYLQQVI